MTLATVIVAQAALALALVQIHANHAFSPPFISINWTILSSCAADEPASRPRPGPGSGSSAVHRARELSQ
ncbi:hypothetical protein GSI_01451 [Ganoderma sinense ZZ0214-1]|uniref:Transporter n=1 Tax=Ganoderma sinense ZZ0214-1 TaxID=1077348 RepID=A0A2G8SVG2_9APHY|nr:hypothetical protein GSI_01451 [Ganoderma sinense ZZ0214-1]